MSISIRYSLYLIPGKKKKKKAATTTKKSRVLTALS